MRYIWHSISLSDSSCSVRPISYNAGMHQKPITHMSHVDDGNPFRVLHILQLLLNKNKYWLEDNSHLITAPYEWNATRHFTFQHFDPNSLRNVFDVLQDWSVFTHTFRFPYSEFCLSMTGVLTITKEWCWLPNKYKHSLMPHQYCIYDD